MPVDYNKRREQRRKMAEQLPPSLWEKVSLRNIEAVCKLPPQARETLATTLDAGLQSIPAAIRYMRENPDASVEEIFKVREQDGRKEQDSHSHILPTSVPFHPRPPNTGDVAALADIYQFAHPSSHRIAAEAWAGAPQRYELAVLARAWRELIERPANSPRSETVIVVACAFLVKAEEQLSKLIAERLVYQQALCMSGVPWSQRK
jgi:hypothetical protein